MFATVSAGIADRHLSSQRTVALIKSLEETSNVTLASACKGLAFVQLYATYEYSVRSAVQATLIALRAAGVEMRTLRRELLALILDSHWDLAHQVSGTATRLVIGTAWIADRCELAPILMSSRPR